jgi:acyl-CoA dehydrogenase
VDDFGSTAHWARRLGRMALTTDEPWDLVVSCPTPR